MTGGKLIEVIVGVFFFVEAFDVNAGMTFADDDAGFFQDVFAFVFDHPTFGGGFMEEGADDDVIRRFRCMGGLLNGRDFLNVGFGNGRAGLDGILCGKRCIVLYDSDFGTCRHGQIIVQHTRFLVTGRLTGWFGE